jgi:hypothetical protein
MLYRSPWLWRCGSKCFCEVCGVWRFVAFCGVLWRFVAFCGFLWLFGDLHSSGKIEVFL